MSVSDPAVFPAAARMACDAVRGLSKDHFVAQRKQHDRAFSEPPCEYLFGFADRGMEGLLQRGIGLTRNVCLLKTARFGQGPWAAQVPADAIAAGPAPPVFFDRWTRSRDALCGDAARAAALAQQCCADDAAACFI